MTKKELETMVRDLSKDILRLKWENETIRYLKFEDAKKRDYIVRNKYLGKITHKQIREDFKNEIKEKCEDGFDSITNKLLNYEFYFENKNILELFSETLKKYEYKQLIMDTYGNKA
jgi:hypothetical protein